MLATRVRSPSSWVVMDPHLRTAALKGDLAALNHALDDGADPNAADDDGYNPLIYAACNDRVACAARLIKAGARVDCHTKAARTGFSRTPLNIAVRYGYAYMVRVLVAGGAQIDYAPTTEAWLDGRTTLGHALTDPNQTVKPAQRKVIAYLRAVRAAGGFPAYARAHRSRFAAIFSRGTRLPADVIPTIVEYWAHLGWYKYE